MLHTQNVNQGLIDSDFLNIRIIFIEVKNILLSGSIRIKVIKNVNQG